MEYKDWIKTRRVKWYLDTQEHLEGKEHLPEFVDLEKRILKHLGSGSYYHCETENYDGILSDESLDILDKHSGKLLESWEVPGAGLSFHFYELSYEKFVENLGEGNECHWLQWEGTKVDKTSIPYVLIYWNLWGFSGYTLMIRSTPDDVRQFKKILPNLFTWDRVEACMNEGTFDQVDAVDLAGYLRRQFQSEFTEFPSSGGSPTGKEYEFTVKKGGKEFRILVEGPMESPVD